MANWREIRRTVKRGTGKAISRVGDVSDNASLRLKLVKKEAALSELYEQLGRIAYQKAKTNEDVSEKAEVLIEKIDIIRAEVYSIKAAFKEKQERREAEIAEAEEIEKAVKHQEDIDKKQNN